MSGPCAGCPGCSPDVRASCQISGPSHSRMHFYAVLLPDVRPSTPDVRAPSARRMSGLLAEYPGIAVQRMFLCWVARRMSGPSCYAGCLGLTPGCPAPLFPALFSALLFKWLAWPDVRPLARMSGLPIHLHYNDHI